MRVLVTGANGFVGQHLVPELLLEGHSVFGFDLFFSTSPAIGMQNIVCDIRDYNSLSEQISLIKPEIIYHFATLLGHVGSSAEEMFNTNVVGTDNLYRIAAQNKVNKIIFLSTNSIWAESNDELIDEAHPYSYVENYGKTKAQTEILLERAVGVKVVILRAPIIMGPARLGLFSFLFLLIKENKWIPIPHSKYNLIEILDVRDLTSALIMSLDDDLVGKFNLGNDLAFSLSDYVKYVVDASNSKSKILEIPSVYIVPLLKLSFLLKLSPFGPYQIGTFVNRFQMSNFKFRMETGWKPQISPRDSLLVAYKSYESMGELTAKTAQSDNMKPANSILMKLIKFLP